MTHCGTFNKKLLQRVVAIFPWLQYPEDRCDCSNENPHRHVLFRVSRTNRILCCVNQDEEQSYRYSKTAQLRPRETFIPVRVLRVLVVLRHESIMSQNVLQPKEAQS